MTIPIPELVPVKIDVLSERTVGIFSMFQINVLSITKCFNLLGNFNA